MTDTQTQTDERLIQEMKLAVITQLHDLTDSTPDETLEDIRQSLGGIYNALDGQGIDTAPIVEAYNLIETLHRQAGSGVDIAAAARAAAHNLAERLQLTAGVLERVRDEKATLEQAILDADTGHHVVEEAWSKLSEQVQEEVYASGAWISYCPACDMIENLPDLSHNVAQVFHEALYYGDDLNEEETAELTQFITQFVRRVADRHQSERTA